ncbi:MAG: hypothetical protein HYY01_08270 [Chloroflexi bacterium]|nr:hypothetical protein [Chloroflexota bacterium]
MFYARGWTDGLPIVPPTEDRVLAMLGGTPRDSQEVVAVLPPRWAEATIEKVAINAVMAGCVPEYMPVVITALEAMAEERFNLMGIQATTHPCAPLVIVNGPVRRRLEMNSGANCLGQGNRANATIGRALRLCLVNLGGGLPGVGDKATQGHPGKYTYCVAENEEDSPWEPLHVERGFAPDTSTVTVAACEAPHNMSDQYNREGYWVLMMVAGSMCVAGSNNPHMLSGEPLVAFGPEHAHTIARDGYSKTQVKEFLYENSQVPIKWYSPGDIEWRHQRFEVQGRLPLTRGAGDLMVIVAGGAGKHSCYMPTFGNTYSVTRPLPLP